MIKKRGRIFLFSVGALFSLAIVCLSCRASEGLQMNIWTEKGEFLTHEPIVIHCRVMNTGDQKHCMNFTKMKEDFVIEDDQGRGYFSHLKGMSMGGDILEPGEMRHTAVEVSGLYSVVNAATYTCYCRTVACASVLNSPRVTSDTIRFQVIKPEGDEEKALNLLLETGKLKYAHHDTSKYGLSKKEQAFMKYQELVDRYPKSVYAPKALRGAIGVYYYSNNMEQGKRIIPACIRLIEEYPRSYYFQLAFTELLHTYEMVKDKKGAVKILQELIRKHPESRISEEAERRLKRVEEWDFE